MMRGEYLLLLAACLVITAPLEWLLGARVYRRPRRLLCALAPVLVVFVGWDLLGIRRHYWSYSASQTTGWVLPGGLPVEEIAFFVVVPICALLAYEAVGRLLVRLRPRAARDAGRGSGGA